jgi:hypothetical protein
MLQFVFGSVLFVAFTAFAQNSPEGRVLDAKFHHLGDSVIEDWPEVSKEPEGTRLDTRFEGEKNTKEVTLAVTYWDINFPTVVQVNGKTIEKLTPSQTRKVAYVRIPAAALKKGENWISIQPSPQDDCVVGNIVLHEKPLADVINVRPVFISVKDSGGKAVPARVAISNSEGKPAEIFLAATNGTAVRTGIIYTLGNGTTIYLTEGNYTFYATRGMEWSRDEQLVTVGKHGRTEVTLRIRREVDTKGFVAADTHLHTVTFSGHGDATVDERMVTLAGEGVEFAVATDHNHHTDYRPYQKQLKANKFFTPITGNEVTTKLGHFNSFPMKLGKDTPDQSQTNWVKLTEEIRLHGAKVIIVNHPRAGRFNVLTPHGYNPFTGERASGTAFPFDGFEIINSAGLRGNGLSLFYDFFGLLNHGERIFAVGASDSHGVAAQVGLGRTYIRSSTDDPGRISVDQMCNNFLAGQSSIAMGIFTEVTVDGKYNMGAIAPVKKSEVQVALRVATPSWISPKQAMLFLNGAKVGEQNIDPSTGLTDRTLSFTIPAPRYDAHLVCVVEGVGIRGPQWDTQQDYAISGTNPVFLDSDGDGRYQSPRTTATKVLAQTGSNLDSRWALIAQADDGVALQMIALTMSSSDAVIRSDLIERVTKAAASRPVFEKYLQSIKNTPAAGG